MREQESREQRFVEGGWKNARTATEPLVRAEVEAEYAERLKEASPWRRFWLRREMEREIRRRTNAAAPRDALYSRAAGRR